MLRGTAARHSLGRTTIHVAIVISLAFGLLAGASGYWAVVEAPGLVRSPNDAAVIAAARTVPRGKIRDRTGKVLADNKTDANGERTLRVSPDALPPGRVRLEWVEVDGRPHGAFDADALTAVDEAVCGKFAAQPNPGSTA